jgi:hypothetical protein
VKDPLLVQRRLPFHSRRRLDLQHHGAYAPVRAAPIPLRRRLTAVRRNSSAYCVGTSLLPGGGRFQRTTRGPTTRESSLKSASPGTTSAGPGREASRRAWAVAVRSAPLARVGARRGRMA